MATHANNCSLDNNPIPNTMGPPSTWVLIMQIHNSINHPNGPISPGTWQRIILSKIAWNVNFFKNHILAGCHQISLAVLSSPVATLLFKLIPQRNHSSCLQSHLPASPNALAWLPHVPCSRARTYFTLCASVFVPLCLVFEIVLCLLYYLSMCFFTMTPTKRFFLHLRRNKDARLPWMREMCL